MNASPVRPAGRILRSGRDYVRDTARRLAREPGQRRAIVLLACVLALNAADQGTIGAVAKQLEMSFGISNTALGLLATISAGAGAVAAIAMGVLADRIRRVPLLAGSVLLWSLAMAGSAVANSYLMLLPPENRHVRTPRPRLVTAALIMRATDRGRNTEPWKRGNTPRTVGSTCLNSR